MCPYNLIWFCMQNYVSNLCDRQFLGIYVYYYNLHKYNKESLPCAIYFSEIDSHILWKMLNSFQSLMEIRCRLFYIFLWCIFIWSVFNFLLILVAHLWIYFLYLTICLFNSSTIVHPLLFLSSFSTCFDKKPFFIPVYSIKLLWLAFNDSLLFSIVSYLNMWLLYDFFSLFITFYLFPSHTYTSLTYQKQRQENLDTHMTWIH